MHAASETPLPAFELRCREGEWIDRPETLTEFSRPASLPAAARNTGLAETLVADMIARSHLEIGALAGDRVIISCELSRHGIPLGVHDLDRPPVGDWKLSDALQGEFVDRDRHGRVGRSLAFQARRGLIAVAGALPLLVSPMLAQAAGPSLAHAPSLEQLAGFAPPKTDGKTDGKSEGKTKKPALPAEPEPTPVPEPAPVDTAAPPAPMPAPAPAPTMAPRTDESLTMTGSTLWEGLLGQQIKLEMKNGQSVAGVVVAQTATDLALARSPDGTVVAVPKSEVGAVRLRIQTTAEQAGGGSNVPIGDRPLQDGRGLSAGGIVMVTLGSIAGLAGTVMLAISPSYVFISLPLLLPGLAMIGGGSAMISSAGKKKKAFDAAWGIPTANVRMMPTLAAGRSGGQAGLILKF